MECPHCRNRPITLAQWVRSQVALYPYWGRIDCRACHAVLRPAPAVRTILARLCSFVLAAGVALFVLDSVLSLTGFTRLFGLVGTTALVDSVMAYKLALYESANPILYAAIAEARARNT